MDINTGKWMETFNAVKEWIVENIFNMQTLIELGIIIAAFIVSKITAVILQKTLKKGIEKIKEKMPLFETPVDMVVEHLSGIFFPMLLFIVNGVADVSGYTTYFIKTVAVLFVAILIIHLVSHVIRNRLLSKFISYTVSSVVALKTFNVYSDVQKYLDSYSMEMGEVKVSIYFIIKGLFIFGLLIWGAGLASSGVSKKLVNSTQLTPSLKVLIRKVFNIVAYLAATLFGLSVLGVNLTAFAVFSGAVGVGIGFGLQKIFSNLISGFILLLDNSIKPGDIIQLDEKFGTVKNMGGRYISVAAWDGTEYLIPNEDIVTGRVINWTHSNRNILISLQIGVSYNADPHFVRDLILKAAGETLRVLKDPPPACHLKGFGESSVDFVLYCWIRDPENGMMNLKSEIYFKVWDIFKENNIEIPFPQRDVHIKSENTAAI